MPGKNRQTFAFSTQAGCSVDCHFCLQLPLGLISQSDCERNYRDRWCWRWNSIADGAEATDECGLMGQGEPLLNYEAVLAALRIFTRPRTAWRSRRSTQHLSTSGNYSGIEKLGLEKCGQACDFAERISRTSSAHKDHADNRSIRLKS